ncbi:hypothetical protein CCYN49044_90015 [Capnocytophaga cynodegmi]|nr:hypothetical protein CCYN49044_90015 [Capnocytophaga cynodegmi]
MRKYMIKFLKRWFNGSKTNFEIGNLIINIKQKILIHYGRENHLFYGTSFSFLCL